LENNCLDTSNLSVSLVNFINVLAEPNWQNKQNACQINIPSIPAPSYG
jgi:hypothetical protein